MYSRSIPRSTGMPSSETLTRLCKDHLLLHLELNYVVLIFPVHSCSFEFDSLVTAPLSNFPTAIAYYRWASAANTIRDIRVPFLGISALDDPIVDSSGIPFEAVEDNEYLTFAVTKHGGHVRCCSFPFSSDLNRVTLKLTSVPLPIARLVLGLVPSPSLGRQACCRMALGNSRCGSRSSSISSDDSSSHRRQGSEDRRRDGLAHGS